MCSLCEAEMLKVVKQFVSFKICVVMHMHRRESCTDETKIKIKHPSRYLFCLFCAQPGELPTLKMLHFNK